MPGYTNPPRKFARCIVHSARSFRLSVIKVQISQVAKISKDVKVEGKKKSVSRVRVSHSFIMQERFNGEKNVST